MDYLFHGQMINPGASLMLTVSALHERSRSLHCIRHSSRRLSQTAALAKGLSSKAEL